MKNFDHDLIPLEDLLETLSDKGYTATELEDLFATAMTELFEDDDYDDYDIEDFDIDAILKKDW